MKVKKMMVPMEFIEELKPMKVLLIDDEKHIRQSLRNFFKKKISSFAAYENAEDAIARLDSDPNDIYADSKAYRKSMRITIRE